MKKNIWLIALALAVTALWFLYNKTPYSSAELSVTREEAVDIAREFLNELDYNTDDYTYEAGIDNGSLVSGYIINKSGDKVYEEKVKNDSIPLHGWDIYFHKNLLPSVPQITYSVFVSHTGKVYSFSREIPDTTSIKSLTQELAAEKIASFLKEHTDVNLDEFTRTKVKEDNFGNRFDYKFQWEKESSNPAGKIVLQASMQGKEFGSYKVSFQLPPSSKQDNTGFMALFATVSFIFIFLMVQVAVISFIKKYHAGEVWINTGKVLFITYFVVAAIATINSWPGLGQDVVMGTDVFTKKIIMLGIYLFLFNIVLALLLFAGWAVGESYSREIWKEKLEGVDAVIKGKIFSNQSGLSFLQGMVLGTVIIIIHGILAIILNNSHGGMYVSPTPYFSVFNRFLPALDVITDAFGSSLISSVVLTFFIINISYRKWHKRWLSVLLSAIVVTLGFVVTVTIPSTNMFSMDIVLILLLGIIYGIIYFRYGLLTLVCTQFTIMLLRGLGYLSAGTGTFFEINTAIIILVYISGLVIYIVSRVRNENFVLEKYGLPSHVERISERERMKKELELAAKIQLSLLPKENPAIEGYDFAGISIPAKEAGGDYYDFVNLGGHELGIAIGDVSGKGMGAAIYMTLTKGILQAHAEENASPKTVLGKVNRLLYRTIEKNTFVSMFYAILDYQNDTLLYSRAGHNPGILCSGTDGNTRFLKSKGMALGLEEGTIFKNTLVEESIDIKPGDVLVLYTDGFTEAMNNNMDEYGEERFTNLISSSTNKSSGEILELILEDVSSFIEEYPQHDDMTIVIIKKKL